MREVATCQCGGQEWRIYGTEIECIHCRKRYLLQLTGDCGEPLETALVDVTKTNNAIKSGKAESA